MMHIFVLVNVLSLHDKLTSSHLKHRLSQLQYGLKKEYDGTLDCSKHKMSNIKKPNQ